MRVYLEQTRQAILTFGIGVLLGLSATTAHAQMPRTDLNIGLYRIDAEVAATPADRMQGLMQRQAMAPHQGMVFSFTFLERHCMWMKNTLLPLSVAFLDESGVILNIADMQPQTETNHCAAGPARYALEMNAGWFAQRGLKPGMRINGLDRLPPPR